MSKKTNKTNKDIKLRYIQEFNSKINKEVLEDLINLNQNLIIDETWKTDPSKDPKDQGNEDKLVLTLDPDNRKTTSYKLIKDLPKNQDYESETSGTSENEDETSETNIIEKFTCQDSSEPPAKTIRHSKSTRKTIKKRDQLQTSDNSRKHSRSGRPV